MPLFDSVTRLREDKIALVSTIGSIASIVALALVLLEKATVGGPSDPQLAAWRIVLFVVALIAGAGAFLFTCFWVKAATAPLDPTVHRVIASMTVRLVLGLLLVGVCIDGVYAAIYWRGWMGSPFLLLKWFFLALLNEIR